MKLALGTNVQVRFQVFTKDNRPAGLAFSPQPFRAHSPLFWRRRLLNSFFLSLEPGHFCFLSALRTRRSLMPCDYNYSLEPDRQLELVSWCSARINPSTTPKPKSTLGSNPHHPTYL